MSLPLGLGCLIEKRAELAGEIRQLEDRLEQLRSDVLHVDAVIRLVADDDHAVDGALPRPAFTKMKSPTRSMSLAGPK